MVKKIKKVPGLIYNDFKLEFRKKNMQEIFPNFDF